jgi:type IV secretion system protein VirB5
MLTVKMQPPKTADALRKNPLGLFVNAIDWARELEGPPATADQQPPQQPIVPAPTTPTAMPVQDSAPVQAASASPANEGDSAP